MKPTSATVIQKIKDYMITGDGKSDKLTQACNWVDSHALQQFEEERIEMQDEIFQLDLYIEEAI